MCPVIILPLTRILSSTVRPTRAREYKSAAGVSGLAGGTPGRGCPGPGDRQPVLSIRSPVGLPIGSVRMGRGGGGWSPVLPVFTLTSDSQNGNMHNVTIWPINRICFIAWPWRIASRHASSLKYIYKMNRRVTLKYQGYFYQGGQGALPPLNP